MTASSTCAVDRTPSTNTATDTYEYDAFGNELSSTGSTPNPYMYRGDYFDSDLGLYYLRARYYNPITGRFMSRDPENGDYRNPVTLHKYLYAGGDPVNGWDPTGRAELVATGLLDLKSLAATAGLIAEARAISCTLMLAASELGAEVNHFQITGIDWVSCSVKVKKDCDEQYEDDLDTCRSLKAPGARSRCYESALNRKNRCEQGWEPLPPLITW